MRPTLRQIAIVVFPLLAGCQTVHTTGTTTGHDMPVAVWVGGVITDQQGRPAEPPTGGRIRDALARAGISATVDAEGVSVAAADAARAEQVLVTDPALAGSGVNVLLIVPAGTGRLSNGGITVPLAAQPVTRP